MQSVVITGLEIASCIGNDLTELSDCLEPIFRGTGIEFTPQSTGQKFKRYRILPRKHACNVSHGL